MVVPVPVTLCVQWQGKQAVVLELFQDALRITLPGQQVAYVSIEA